MMWESLLEVFKHSVMITGFVFVMMLLIEYINVQTRGVWLHLLRQKLFYQYILAGLLGAVPGCLGAFTVVALYSHGIVSLGALVTAMIATSGDETFVMLAMIPETALIIIAATFLIGIGAGFLTDKLFPGLQLRRPNRKLPLHLEEKCNCLPEKHLLENMKNPSMQRVLLIVILVMILAGYSSGFIAAELLVWLKITVILVSLFLLFVVITVPDHFLEEHLWAHIVKKHLPQIFFWTLASLLVIHLALEHFDLNTLIKSNLQIVLIIALLTGLIPESGPHLIFVTLFAHGSIPLSILLASSIVQDGHGMIPLLAETKRGFVMVKLVNLAVGFVIGVFALRAGF